MKSSFLAALANVIFLCSCATVQQNGRSEPKNTAFTQGNQYARDGLLREAVDSYKAALKKEPDNLQVHRNLGIVLVKAGDFSGAIQHLEKSVAAFDDNFETNYYLAESYRATDKYAEAIFRYKNALKSKKEDVRALKALAWSYYKIRFYSEALTTTQKLTTLAPHDEHVPIIISRIKLKLDRASEALATIRKGQEKAPASAIPYFQSVEAEILVAMGDEKGAQATYQKALQRQPMLAGALLGLGQIFLSQGKNKEATDFLERAVRIKPKLYEAQFFLAKALENTQPQRAIKYYANFYKHASSDPELTPQIKEAKTKVGILAKKTTLNNAN